MYIPSFKLISQSMLKKSPENKDGRTDGQTDGRTLPRHNTSRFPNGHIKTHVVQCKKIGQSVKCLWIISRNNFPFTSCYPKRPVPGSNNSIRSKYSSPNTCKFHRALARVPTNWMYYIKFCASFQIHRLMQTEVTVRKCSNWAKIGDFLSWEN